MVVGAAGTGKTTALIDRVATLILEKKTAPTDIAVLSFTWRLEENTRAQLASKLPADQIPVIGTFKDIALKALEAESGGKIEGADNAKARHVLRRAMAQVGFAGTLTEAEHIMRSFKSRARKPQENEKYFDLLSSYKTLMERDNLLDRHDVIRKHILGLKEGTLKPIRPRLIFVDNIQDATQLQMLWLLEHAKLGAILYVCGNDDATAFGRDGALGEAIFEDMAAELGTTVIPLKTNFRLPKALGIAAQKSVELARPRIEKPQTFAKNRASRVVVRAFANRGQEGLALVQQLKTITQNGGKDKIGVITRTDYHANRLHHWLTREEVPHVCTARTIWETPGAGVMMDLLHVLIGSSDQEQVKSVLVALGLNRALVDALCAAGLGGREWFKNGAPLPEGVDLPGGTLQAYGAIQRDFIGYWQLLTERAITPRDVFKAAAHDMLPNLSKYDQRDALLALDVILSIKGKLSEAVHTITTEAPPLPEARLTISPVREVRNMEFDTVFLPFATPELWPYTHYPLLGSDPTHERRVFHLAITRTKGDVLITHTDKPSPYVVELQKNHAQALQNEDSPQ